MTQVFEGLTLASSLSKLRSSKEMRDKAYRLCREYLSGSWKNISSSDLVFTALSGGLSNLLYHCSLPKTHTPLDGEPDQVLLRMYGQVHDGQVEANITESIIFMLLSERNLGPKLYGIFPEGRLEEYIPAKAMTCQELQDPDISTKIARKLAFIHQLEVPINKEPVWMFGKMDKWLQKIRSICIENIDKSNRKYAEYLLSQNLESECIWLRSFIENVASPVVFCHNDLQEGNILLPERQNSNEDKVIFIDFEYCSYNYRGFDIANHFLEWCYDYSLPEYPHFTIKMENFPSKEQQLNFIHEYMKSYTRDSLINIEMQDEILREVQVFSLASHLFWTLWSISSGYCSTIRFGYWVLGED
ncbi:choline kinase alpha-like isoform X2 [Tachypleus tridentatus]|uniref:choline kinase alpha-like isoform X2 n=1 Tax=Tachypleus tridentatus TaxID=6853 RepID=UPI003FD0B8F4